MIYESRKGSAIIELVVRAESALRRGNASRFEALRGIIAEIQQTCPHTRIEPVRAHRGWFWCRDCHARILDRWTMI
jgi:hypothetical protein